MFETIAVLVLVMWVLGMGVGYTMGGLIHVLLLVAVISVLFRVINGRKALP